MCSSVYINLYLNLIYRLYASIFSCFFEGTSLHGKVAIVTGASSGIGAAIAEALIKAGANVALAARRIDKLKDLCKKLEEDGSGLAIAVKTDVTNKEDVSFPFNLTLFFNFFHSFSIILLQSAIALAAVAKIGSVIYDRLT